MVRHYGVLVFKKEISEAEIEESLRTMKELVLQIPGLLDMEYGPYSSPEGMNDGFTHGFLITFDSEESRDAYLPHPIHEQAKGVVVPRLERAIVFDFVVK
ncbi:Dabb family protein [Parapedobacter pyrenivorans]|uniref:Dabb family protein n=1 Tax=Parapedobacter pyrenivorans TaxID=1305674 RepID=UPI00333F6667